jgi:hypothetical protein
MIMYDWIGEYWFKTLLLVGEKVEKLFLIQYLCQIEKCPDL